MTTKELKNYVPKGQLKGFPKEIIACMLDCQEVRDKACKIWFKLNISYIRKRYKKYTRKYKLNN
ncbi:MAG: hypothetical protein ACK5MH_08960 [Bacteroidales bacterium]